MNIRFATDHDASDIAILLNQLGYPATVEDAQTRIKYMSTPNNALLIAEDNNKAVGLIGVHLLPMIHATGLMSKITGLVVDEQYRGKGIGRKLLDAAEEFSLENGSSRIEVVSGNHRPEAHKFYMAKRYNPTNQTRFILDLSPSAKR